MFVKLYMAGEVVEILGARSHKKLRVVEVVEGAIGDC
jgi:hypothetical protein